MNLDFLFLPVGADLALTAAEVTAAGVAVRIQSTATTASCPVCHHTADRVHSHTERCLHDLSLAHIPVQIHLVLPRFRCENLACPRTTFTEPVPALAKPYAHRTTRLRAEQRQLALEVGGEPGARVSRRQGMAISPDTLLRLAREAPATALPTPRCLGIDDFALRKGQVYGTIFVDLEAHRPIDLVPERSAEVVAQWLKAHPGVQVITRDRSGEYAEGARRGAPTAVQVADRFHLLQNIREVLQRLLDGQQEALAAAVHAPAAITGDQPAAPPAPAPSAMTAPLVTTLDQASAATTSALPSAVALGAVPAEVRETTPEGPSEAAPAAPRLSKAAQQGQNRRARRQARYTAVRELYAQGLGMRTIAARLHLSRNTVRRFVAAEQFPERATRRAARSKLDPFIPYLEQHLAAGQDNGMQLWRELRAHEGYTGSRGLVSHWVARHRHLVPPVEPTRPPVRRRGRPPATTSAPAPAPQRHLSARQAAWLLVCQPEKRKPDEQDLVQRLCQHTPLVATAYQLAQEFIQLVREHQVGKLDPWIRGATASGIPEFQSFVTGLERDKAAVIAALTLPFSNGQVEGQVNRLKVIKRCMYGRAKFDLLRQRVLTRSS
jgi:transposase